MAVSYTACAATSGPLTRLCLPSSLHTQAKQLGLELKGQMVLVEPCGPGASGQAGPLLLFLASPRVACLDEAKRWVGGGARSGRAGRVVLGMLIRGAHLGH